MICMKKITDNVYHKRFGYFNIYILRGIDGDILVNKKNTLK